MRHGAADDDLAAIVVDDSPAPVDHRLRSDRLWLSVVLTVSAALAAVALGTIAWQQREQTKILRHQQCIGDATARSGFSQFPGAQQQALSPCFNGKATPIPPPAVTVPLLRSVPIDEALLDLKSVGLHGDLVSGPSTTKSVVISQSPAGGQTVLAGTDVELTTGPPQP